LVLSPDKVTLEEAYSFVGQASVSMNTTDAYHIYRLTRDTDGLYWHLFIDNNPVAAIADQHSGGELISFSRVWFGDINFPIPGNTPEVQTDYIRWHQGANAPASLARKWLADANGNWSDSSKWQYGAPNGTGMIANLTDAITAPRTITLDAPVTLSGVNFNNLNRYTIAGTATLTMDVPSGSASINLGSGSHTIAAPVVLAKNTNVIVTPSSGALTISGDVS